MGSNFAIFVYVILYIHDIQVSIICYKVSLTAHILLTRKKIGLDFC